MPAPCIVVSLPFGSVRGFGRPIGDGCRNRHRLPVSLLTNERPRSREAFVFAQVAM